MIGWGTIGYCPWCGAERTVEAQIPRRGQWEWYPCKTPRCKGAMILIISDDNGFVIHPKHQRGKYLLARRYDDGNE